MRIINELQPNTHLWKVEIILLCRCLHLCILFLYSWSRVFFRGKKKVTHITLPYLIGFLCFANHMVYRLRLKHRLSLTFFHWTFFVLFMKGIWLCTRNFKCDSKFRFEIERNKLHSIEFLKKIWFECSKKKNMFERTELISCKLGRNDFKRNFYSCYVIVITILEKLQNGFFFRGDVDRSTAKLHYAESHADSDILRTIFELILSCNFVALIWFIECDIGSVTSLFQNVYSLSPHTHTQLVSESSCMAYTFLITQISWITCAEIMRMYLHKTINKVDDKR